MDLQNNQGTGNALLSNESKRRIAPSPNLTKKPIKKLGVSSLNVKKLSTSKVAPQYSQRSDPKKKKSRAESMDNQRQSAQFVLPVRKQSPTTGQRGSSHQPQSEPLIKEMAKSKLPLAEDPKEQIVQHISKYIKQKAV